MTEDTFDYVIVGAGLGGLRAGRPPERGRPQQRAAAGERRLGPVHLHPDADGVVDSDEHAEIQLVLSHASRSRISAAGSLHTPRGKVLGGSSSINGLVYVRGNPLDFDRWEEEGAHGWSYQHVLPYFRRAEKRAGGGDATGATAASSAPPRGVHDQPVESRLD